MQHDESNNDQLTGCTLTSRRSRPTARGCARASPATPQPGKDAKPSHLNLAAFQQKYAPLLDRLEQADGGSSTETVFKSRDGDGNGVIEGAEMGDLNAKVNAAIRADYKGETVDSTAAAQKSIDRQARHPHPSRPPSPFLHPIRRRKE